MALAPVEYVVIEFPGNRFTGDIAPALAELVEDRLVRIIDLVFVLKNADGDVTTFEYDELPEGAAYAEIDGEADGLLSDSDILDIADGLEPESSALLVLFEDLWAAKFADAVWAAGGQLVAGGRLPRDLIEAAVEAAGES